MSELFAVLTIRVSIKGGYSPSMDDEDAITEAFCRAESAVATALDPDKFEVKSDA